MGATTSKVVPSKQQPANIQFDKIQLQSPTVLEPTFRFLDLPPEIRCMVYEELLVVGKVYFKGTDREHWTSARYHAKAYYRKPSLAVFRVCKIMHEEAEPIYLAKNLFILPSEWQTMEPFYSGRHSQSLPRNLHLFSKKSKHHLRNISIAIDKDDQSEFGFDSIVLGDSAAARLKALPQGQRLCLLHDSLLEQLFKATYNRAWNAIPEYLEGMFKDSKPRNGTPQLRYVEFDYTNAYCPFGCCRPVELVNQAWLSTIGTKHFAAFGIEGGSEHDRADAQIMVGLKGFVGPTIEWKLKGDEDQWSKWRCDKPQRYVPKAFQLD